MTAIRPIHACADAGSLVPERKRRRATDRAEAMDVPDDARMAPQLALPIVAAVSAMLWFALTEVVIVAIRLPLFS